MLTSEDMGKGSRCKGCRRWSLYVTRNTHDRWGRTVTRRPRSTARAGAEVATDQATDDDNPDRVSTGHAPAVPLDTV
jgi:hypothetical protein